MLLDDLLTESLAWNPRAGDTVLLGAVADDIPLAQTIVATLPPKARGQVFLEVADASEIRAFDAPGRVCVTWLLRDRGQTMRAAVDAWLSEMLPIDLAREHRVYAWVSGDACARALSSD